MAKASSPFKTLAGMALLGACSWASALDVSIVETTGPGPYAPGSLVTFSVYDANPSDMCDLSLGVCAGDFTLGYDPTKLALSSYSIPGALTWASAVPFAGLGGTWGGFLDVSLVAVDPVLLPVPTTSTELFSVTFVTQTVLPADAFATVYLDPTDFGIGSFSYNFQGSKLAVEITTTSVIPEPSTYALMGLGLAALAAGARRRSGPRAGSAA